MRSRHQELYECSNPVAFVTGSGAPRVGRSIAESLAEAGYRIVVHAYRSIREGEEFVEQLRRLGTDALFVQGPVEDEETVRSWIEQIDNRFGRLDLMVHSSAIWESTKLEATSANDLMRMLEVNVVGPFLCAQICGLFMAKQKTGGSILLIGDWAIERPYVDFAPYFISKGTIPTMTRTMAVELASRNPKVRVNCVMPGPVLLYSDADEELKTAIQNHSLLQRSGSPSDIADGILFLAEQPFTSGVTLSIDGGRSIFSRYDNDHVAHPSRKNRASSGDA